MSSSAFDTPVRLPRVVITFCTQCKWMLRAAYFAQELMSTFGTSIGEVALVPSTGGVFTVDLAYKPTQSQLEVGDDPNEAKHVLLWDRKSEGGFPETKILKQRLRNIIEPEKALGHSDTPSNKGQPQTAAESTVAEGQASSKDCEDCK
ncbi:hypothetical protein CB0940_01128 [Cercospora beticola]|uniref:Uncharacterized protein n=1 Tax=Cercospora beticola TaxID=122368 RepID=A0A2G5I7I9_CERBT|nr:hypothetical protein CB0940_01128 [Cercospora beticola]PIB00453.1 hypothetical protein CB0940_01128 [Cercospora beticola]WPA96556.1 hypothetical protein RHO25_001163 [Cercospora beticola]